MIDLFSFLNDSCCPLPSPWIYVRIICYNLSISQTIPSLHSHRISAPPRSTPTTPASVRPTAPPVSPPVGRHVQHELPEAVPRSAAHQAAAPGLHHPHPALDLRPVLQGPALRLPAHRHALLHLRHNRHAGQRERATQDIAGVGLAFQRSARPLGSVMKDRGYNGVVESNCELGIAKYEVR